MVVVKKDEMEVRDVLTFSESRVEDLQVSERIEIRR